MNEKQILHGWDDEKIYLWDDDAKKEWCVTDEEDLYNQLLEMCIAYFKKKEKEAKEG
jgi:hypothetical protein